jgi:hypothetical protein
MSSSGHGNIFHKVIKTVFLILTKVTRDPVHLRTGKTKKPMCCSTDMGGDENQYCICCKAHWVEARFHPKLKGTNLETCSNKTSGLLKSFM